MQTVLEHVNASRDAGGFALRDERCDEGGELAGHLIVYTRTRDSDGVENANFSALRRALPEWEILGFNHFLCGWYELLVVPPTAREAAEGLLARLEDHPLLDEDAVAFCKRCEVVFEIESTDTEDEEFCSRWCEESHASEREREEERAREAREREEGSEGDE